MNEINKDFDGMQWEWKGRNRITDLKPICPDCMGECDIKMHGFDFSVDNRQETKITIRHGRVSYVCSNCSFSKPTTIDNVDEPKDLSKAAMREFERRLRLKLSGNTKD